MGDVSILIGGKAGFGIDKSSFVIANIMAGLGYRIYIYRDYPSLIRGGHTFCIIRGSDKKVSSHRNSVDILLALNQDTIDIHKDKLADKAIILYDSDSVKGETLPPGKQTVGMALMNIIKETGAPEIMRNTCIIGALCKAVGIEWDILEAVIKKDFERETDLNLKIARRGYDAAGKELTKITRLDQEALPVSTGNEAVSSGLIKAGLKAYIAYPMTPSSPILHFMANAAEGSGLKVVHPENEIAVILMALGFSYCGQKTAVGTSGGGFCLMTEGLSLSAMAELPVVVVMGQRPGPSTGLPTYSSQTDLGFALNAGHGEFTRFLVAPGDPEESYYWSQVALNMAWRYQIPSIILTDKDMGEGSFSFDVSSVKELKEEQAIAWNGQDQYKRYQDTETGVSPAAFVPDNNAVIKVNSYEHDEYGITTEDPAVAVKMQDKRLRKERYLAEELGKYETVKVYGNNKSSTVILCWGSAKNACVEAGVNLGLKVVQPMVLSPLPVERLRRALEGASKVIAVENNATGQLVKLINRYGMDADEKIFKYDGRPFSVDDLEARLKAVMR